MSNRTRRDCKAISGRSLGKKKQGNRAKSRLNDKPKGGLLNTENSAASPLSAVLTIEIGEEDQCVCCQNPAQQIHSRKRDAKRNIIIIHDPRLGFFGEISKKVARSRGGSQWSLIFGMLPEAHASDQHNFTLTFAPQILIETIHLRKSGEFGGGNQVLPTKKRGCRTGLLGNSYRSQCISNLGQPMLDDFSLSTEPGTSQSAESQHFRNATTPHDPTNQ